MLKPRLTPLIISLLGAFYFFMYPPPSLAVQNPGIERREHLKTISGLEGEAQRLALELLALDLKLKKAGQEREMILINMTSTRKKKDDSAEEYRKSLEMKNQKLKKMGAWLNFQYRYGYLSLLDIVLGSGSLSDLFSRSAAVAVILGRQAKDYKSAADACEASLQMEKTLKDAEYLLELQNRALTEQINNITNLVNQRREFLDEIRRESSQLAHKVASLEKRFIDSLNLMENLTGALDRFSWREVTPDRVLLSPGGILVEVSEQSLNQSFQTSGIKNLEGLSVELEPGLFVLTGRDKNSPSVFTLGCSLSAAGSATPVRLTPKTLSLDGIPVTETVLRKVADESAFYLPIPEEMRSFEMSVIEIHEGKMNIRLSF